MRQILFILLVFCTYPSHGQIDNYLKYQELINSAELELINNKKEAALDLYCKALLNSNGNFCKDIYNALLISYEINHIDTFYNLLDLLLAKGLDNESLKKNIIKPPNTDERWKSFLSANNVTSVKDELLRSKIDSLHFIDQYFRKKEGSYKTYGDTIKIIDSLNMDFLYNLVLNDQFPGELEIGVRNFASRQGYDIVFHHYAQGTSENMKQKITPIIINLVLQGKILPNKAAQWLELQNDEFSAGVFDILSFKVDNKSTDYYVSNYTKERKLYINQYRKLLGMESLDEYHQKFIFKLNNPSSKYIFDLQKNIFHLDKDTFEKVIKGMRRLEPR